MVFPQSGSETHERTRRPPLGYAKTMNRRMTRVQIEGAFRATLNLRGGSESSRMNCRLKVNEPCRPSSSLYPISSWFEVRVLRDGIRVRRRKLIGCVRRLFAEIPVLLRIGVEDVEPAQRDRTSCQPWQEAVEELVGGTVERVVIALIVSLRPDLQPAIWCNRTRSSPSVAESSRSWPPSSTYWLVIGTAEGSPNCCEDWMSY